MIINCQKLDDNYKQRVATEVANLSRVEGSSLLSKSESDVLKMMRAGMVIAKLNGLGPLFTVAFEPTPNPNYIEVGLVANLAIDQVRGREIFPEIINHYHLSHPQQTLYLTTTNIKMKKLGAHAGFEAIAKIDFPKAVIEFCCQPCSLEKTGVKEAGAQIKTCPRFQGQIPLTPNSLTNHPCFVMIKKF